MLRHQLASYSPLRASGLLRAARTSARNPSRALEALEDHLRERFGALEVLLVDSGTHALQIALEVAGHHWRAPRESSDPPTPVAVLPAYSCYDLVTAAVGAGVGASFYDVDPETLTPDPSSVRAALGLDPSRDLPSSRRVCGLVGGNLYGLPLDWGFLREAATDAGTILIEDAAQGLGTAWQGRPGGTFGDLTILSFGRGKGWTGGGGGALLVRRDDLVEAVLGWRSRLSASRRSADAGTAVRAALQWGLGRPGIYGIPVALPGLHLGRTVYHPPTPPAPMTPFAAAATMEHRSDARSEIAPRLRNADIWQRELPPGLRGCHPAPGGEPAFHRFPIVCPDAATAHRLLARGRRLGLSQGYPTPLPLLEAAGPIRATPAGVDSRATDLARRLITLPTHSRVSARDRRRITTLLKAEAPVSD